MRNLILISLDTLRADVAYSGKFKNIEKLRQQGVSFKNTIASAPLTPISHASVFSGLQPSKHGIRHLFKEQINRDVPLLAEVLKNRGYETGAIVSCPGMNSWYGFNRGFDHYDDEIPLLPNGDNPLHSVDVAVRGTALKRAPLVVERALDWFLQKRKQQDKGIFLFIHFFDAHWPYEPPENYGAVATNAYEGEVAYVDHYLGIFFEALRKAGHDMDEDLVVLFSDHGEDLNGWYPNDHGGIKLGHPEEKGHGCLLYDATQRVPLIISCPRLNIPQREITQQVALVDIMPTIIELLRLDQPHLNFDGRSLVKFCGENQDFFDSLMRISYSETFYLDEISNKYIGSRKLSPLKAIRINNQYKIIWKIDSDLIEVYDLLADPNEYKPQQLCANKNDYAQLLELI